MLRASWRAMAELKVYLQKEPVEFLEISLHVLIRLTAVFVWSKKAH